MVPAVRWLGVIVLTLITGSTFAQEIVVQNGVTYAMVGDVRLQLDVAYPKDGPGPYPGLVLIHGGGWQGGNRHAYRSKMEEAARRGYVAATVSYRLTQADPQTGQPREPFPAQIHDCKSAIRWLKAHAADFGLDPNRMGVMGASAGGHLSLLVGLTSPADGLEGDLGHPDQSSRVQAVVNIFGPTDLPVIYKSTPAVVGMLKALCNGTPETAAERYQQASPVTYVTNDDPPILTLHGDADQLVPLEQARILDEVLKKAGVPHELKVLAGQGHGFQGEAGVEADKSAWEFLDKQLKPARP